MEPRLVYRHLAGHTLVNDLHRTLKELYHSRAAAPTDALDSGEIPQPILQKFRIGKLRSSPGHQRISLKKRQVEETVCPVCSKIRVPKLLIVSSQEMQEKQCLCDSQKPSPKHSLQTSVLQRKLRLGNKQQHRGKSVSDMSKNPSEKSLSTYQINTAVLKLMPLNPSHVRLAGMLRANLLDIHRISSSPKQSLLEDDSMAEISRSALHDSFEPASRLASVLEIDSTHKFVIYPGNNSKLIQRLMVRRRDWVEGKLSDAYAQFAWHPTSRTVRFDRFVPYQGVQVVNHFEFHSELSNKLNLFKNLRHYCEKRTLNILDFMPLTFSIEFESNRFHAQYSAFTSFFKTLAETGKKGNKDKTACLPATHNSGANVWLLKPSGFNRGRGIYVFSSLEEFKAILDDYHEAARINPKSEKLKVKPELIRLPSLKFVIQKYIERPLLLHSRKFDIRVWVLLTQEMHGYLYREGYLRTSSEEFTLEKSKLASQYVHLTNNAVQKTSPMYGKFENGNQVSFSQFQEYLDAHGISLNVRSDVFPRMKSLIKHSLVAACKKLNPQKRTVCFELFGYDFIIDEEMGLWLIEVNTNPCLELSSPLLEQLIPRMLDDMLKLTVDKLFPTEIGEGEQPQGKNNWEHVVALGHKAI